MDFPFPHPHAVGKKLGVIPSERPKHALTVGKSALPPGPYYDPAFFSQPILMQGFSPECFLAGTPVLMADGNTQPIEEVRIGEEVIDAYGNPQVVIRTMSRPWQGRMYDITPYGGLPVTVTPNHPFLTDKGFVNAEDLTDKHYVCLPINSSIKDKTDWDYERRPDFLRVLGLYLAEGSVQAEGRNGRNRVEFGFCTDEPHYVAFVESTIKTIFNVAPSITIDDKHHVIHVVYNNAQLAAIFHDLGGKYAKHKRIHSKFLLLEPELQLEIVRGWMMGDGHARRREVTGVSISKTLIDQMFFILERNHILSSIALHSDNPNKETSYDLSVYGGARNRLFPESAVTEPNRRPGHQTGDVAATKIVRKVRKIEKIKSEHGNYYTVYNLEVAGSHTYTAGFMGVHNCGGFSLGFALAYLLSQQVSLSGSFAYAYEKTVDGAPNVDGTTINAIGEDAQNEGTCLINLFPDDGLQPAPVVSTPFSEARPNAISDAMTRAGFIPMYLSDLSWDGLQSAIAKYKAVIVEAKLGKEWYTAPNGATSWNAEDILPIRPPAEVIDSHFFVLGGKTTPTEIHFANSWSANWGDKGFGWFGPDYIPYIQNALVLYKVPPEVKPVVQTVVNHPTLSPQAKQTILQTIINDIEKAISLIQQAIP